MDRPVLLLSVAFLSTSIGVFQANAQVEKSQPGDLSEKETMHYYVNCLTISVQPQIFDDAGMTNKVNLDDIAFTQYFTFAQERFFFTDGGEQAMSGYLESPRGYTIQSVPASNEPTYRRFYTLTSDWNCVLHRGYLSLPTIDHIAD